MYHWGVEVMKTLSAIMSTTVLTLLLISCLSPIATTSSLESISRLELTSLSDGSAIVTVSEDIGVLNGSYADVNQNNNTFLELGTGSDGIDWYAGRAWFKFNLSEITLPFYRATMFVHVNFEYTLPDEPMGVYYCANDTWTGASLTWNNQPTFSTEASDIIDSPASPNMFVANSWYNYEITEDVRATLAGDRVLTEVLKQTVETGTQDAMDVLDRLSFNPQSAAYIELSFASPSVVNLTTSGFIDSPLIDYIQDSTPTLGWEFSDQDVGDFQTDFTIEVWDSEDYNSTLLWELISETSETTVDYAGPSLVNNTSYYWRVKICDRHSLWSNWAEQSFTFTPLTTGPSYEGPVVSPAIIYVGAEVTVSINVTYFLGVSSVGIDFEDGFDPALGYPMVASGDTYTFSWTPTEAGILNYTISMRSAIDTTTTVKGGIEVLSPGLGDITTLLLIGGAFAAAVVVVIVVLRRKGKSAS
jgi:hypothetical protein